MGPATSRLKTPAADAAACIREAAGPGDHALARALFVEYAQWLGVDLGFQGFDAELASLPGAYAPPRGRLLLAGAPDAAFGCIALRPLEADAGDTAPLRARGEVKRLYVQPARRRDGWGRRLAQAVLAEARAIGYRELKLDTFDWMQPARALYASLGFCACAPYYVNPLPGVAYMSCRL